MAENRDGASKPCPNPSRATVFLDRDGTINEAVNYLTNPKEFVLLPGVAAAIRDLRAAGLLVIVITNQSMIARGWCALETLADIHREMTRQLAHESAALDGIYYCPHHPNPGPNGPFARCCDCRKPKPGMILRAARDFGIDLTQSWMVGDSTRDVLAAQNAGVRSILVATGQGGKDGGYRVTPDLFCTDLCTATDYILGR